MAHEIVFIKAETLRVVSNGLAIPGPQALRIHDMLRDRLVIKGKE